VQQFLENLKTINSIEDAIISLEQSYTLNSKIKNALNFCIAAHEHQKRKSGEPYVVHPILVASITAYFSKDEAMILAALLHDVVEDTDFTLEYIQDNFGFDVAHIVDGLTKITEIRDTSKNNSDDKLVKSALTFRKMIIASTDDVRVLVVKLFDRTHNMLTLDALSKEKQKSISEETLVVYAPIAHRLGISAVKNILEDLSFYYLYPNEYNKVDQYIKTHQKKIKNTFDDFVKEIKLLLNPNEKQNIQIFSRIKHHYSIYLKTQRKGIKIDEVLDLFAIRIITSTSLDCYKVLGKIHTTYRPLVARFKDYVAVPKENGYQTIHTTVFNNTKIFEIQIRTKNMHHIAEFGVAAHWKYKEGKDKSDSGLENWLQNVQAILDDSEQNTMEMVNDFKMELFNDEIFVFTPRGDLKRLKKNATILDFAYEIHSDIGDKCMGAKVNHKLVPLSHVLQTGDQIEILTSKKQKPKEEWLKFVISSKARGAIKRAIKEEYRKIASDGKALVERKFKQLKINHSEENMWTLSDFFNVQSPLDVYHLFSVDKNKIAEVKNLENDSGILKISKEVVQEKVVQAVKRPINNEILDKKNAELLIMGEDSKHMEYSFSKCCNPIPGDDIFGFLSVSEGIKIHRTNCPNAVNMMSKYSYRIVRTKWHNKPKTSFLTGVIIEGIDNVGVVSQVSNLIASHLELNMKSISFESNDGVYEGKIMIYVSNNNELEILMKEIKSLEGVVSITRFEIENEL